MRPLLKSASGSVALCLNYHAIPGNLKRLGSAPRSAGHGCARFVDAANGSRTTWDRFQRYVGRYIPKVRACHPHPIHGTRHDPRQEPYTVAPHVGSGRGLGNQLPHRDRCRRKTSRMWRIGQSLCRHLDPLRLGKRPSYLGCRLSVVCASLSPITICWK